MNGCLNELRPASALWSRLARETNVCAALMAALLVACGANPGSSGGEGDGRFVLRDEPAGEREAGVDAGVDAGAAAREPGLDATLGEQPVVREQPAEGGARTNVVLPGRWRQVDAHEDPFADRPEVVSCAAEGVGAEELSGLAVFGVETALCSYLTVTQPTLRALAVGEVLRAKVWHFELQADEPAEAHVAVTVDGLSVLEQRVAIPAAGGSVSQELRLERALPPGTPVHFHLHNHGANSWALVELSAGP